MQEGTRWPPPASSAATVPPPDPGYGQASQPRCHVCASVLPPGARFCRACGAPATPNAVGAPGAPATPGPTPRGRRRRTALWVLLAAVVIAAIAVPVWLALDGGTTKHAVDRPASRGGAANPGHHENTPEAARVRRVVLEYGRTLDHHRTCALETQRKLADDWGSASNCLAHVKPNPIDYHHVRVTVHGSKAIVRVSGRLGPEKLWLVKTRRGWLIDAIFHAHPPALQTPGRHVA